MKNYLLALLVLSSFPALTMAEPELKGSAAELTQILAGIPKSVRVTGEAEVRIPASRAVINLSVITETKSLHEALRLNAEVRARVCADLKQQGIALERIKASQFSSTPKFGLWGDKAKSYRVENNLRIAIADEKEFRNAAKVVDSYPEVNYAGVEFEYADKESAKVRAIAQACDSAESRRKIYEERLGLRLQTKSFNEGIVNEKEAMPPVVKSSYEGLSGSYRSAVQESVSSFGEIVFNASVSVEYIVISK